VRSFTDHYSERSLLYAEGLEQIAIEGPGVIDGQGAAFKGGFKARPYLLRIIGCREVSVQGISLRDSPMWVQHYLACDGLRIDGITVLSKCNANNDGIDIDGCQRVRISNCDIRAGDDALVLKSTLDRPCRQVVVANCLLNSDCNAFKLGTESNGGFEDILVSNCAIYDTHLAGIALETVDGGTLEGVNISNLTMRNVGAPIFIRLGNRARPYTAGRAAPGLGSMRNVSISDVQATGAGPVGCSITGLPGHPVENVTLSNLRLRFAGGGKPEDARRQPPEQPEAYPEFLMFGVLPAYAFYCRHARNLAFQNLTLDAAAPDERPSLLCEDVEALRLSAWRAETVSPAAPVVLLQDVRDAAIHGCATAEKPGPWLRVGGKSSARIRLFGNDFRAAAVETAPETPAGALLVPGPGAKTR
jgi:polygalacturonase